MHLIISTATAQAKVWTSLKLYEISWTVVVQALSPNTQKAETGKSLWVRGQSVNKYQTKQTNKTPKKKKKPNLKKQKMPILVNYFSL